MTFSTKTNYTEDEFQNAVRFANQSDNGPDNLNRAKMIGLKGKDITVSPGAIIRLRDLGSIGDYSHIGLYTYINGNVIIGSRVLIGPHCSITSGNHKFCTKTKSFQGGHVDSPVLIKDGAWLSAGVIVTSGVTVGRGCLLCANATVTKDTDDFSLMAGSPAKKIGEINPETGEYIWYGRNK
ncbi:MAG: transferase [Planctomycetota bacterium]|nr:MAG: transferase [Planctomycetota bacterium]